MAKKIRFPLEMDNGLEVRSLEELKSNFSLSRILGYVADGKLVTWLKDRYATDLAEQVEQLDKQDAELAKKVCAIFDVTYDENTEEDMEKAQERNRKLELLREYPEAMKYSSRIDAVAFDQEDLYDLLDEDAPNIYLCGKNFSIPTLKENVKYVGIIKDVMLTISSKEIVDFDAKGIVIENCKFDEKYQNLIDSAKEKAESEELETPEDNAIDEENDVDQEVDADIDLDSVASEINDVVDDLLEAINEFAEKEYDNDYDDLYEYDDSIAADPDDYNDDGFDTKTEAKVACKKAITEMIDDVMSSYEDCKDELIDDTKSYYRDMVTEVPDFVMGTLQDTFYSLLDIHCSDETKAYLESRITEFHTILETNCQQWVEEIPKECEVTFEKLVVERFGKKTASGKKANKLLDMKELFDRCDIDDDDDEYNFDTSDACKDAVDTLVEKIESATEEFPEEVFNAFYSIRSKYIDIVTTWIEKLRIKTPQNTAKQDSWGAIIGGKLLDETPQNSDLSKRLSSFLVSFK